MTCSITEPPIIVRLITTASIEREINKAWMIIGCKLVLSKSWPIIKTISVAGIEKGTEITKNIIIISRKPLKSKLEVENSRIIGAIIIELTHNRKMNDFVMNWIAPNV